MLIGSFSMKVFWDHLYKVLLLTILWNSLRCPGMRFWYEILHAELLVSKAFPSYPPHCLGPLAGEIFYGFRRHDKEFLGSVLSLLRLSLPLWFPVRNLCFCVHWLLSTPAAILTADERQILQLRNVLVLCACYVGCSCNFRRHVPFWRCSVLRCHGVSPSESHVFVCIFCCQCLLEFWWQMHGKILHVNCKVESGCAMFWCFSRAMSNSFPAVSDDAFGSFWALFCRCSVLHCLGFSGQCLGGVLVVSQGCLGGVSALPNLTSHDFSILPPFQPHIHMLPPLSIPFSLKLRPHWGTISASRPCRPVGLCSSGALKDLSMWPSCSRICRKLFLSSGGSLVVKQYTEGDCGSETFLHMTDMT